jgi:hypothetical protein
LLRHIRTLESQCVDFDRGKGLSCENRHELCAYAHKYHRLPVISQQPFDCGGGHTGADSMPGMSFIPEHSDARVLEQLIC